MIRRISALLLVLLLMAGAALGEEEELSFSVRHGSRQSPEIAITMDDGFDLPWMWKTRDLFAEYGITGTFFPIGKMLSEEDGEEWQKVLENGNEIGSHSSGHLRMGNASAWDIIGRLGRFQQQLDIVLGYHYQVQSFRPPYGNIADDSGSTRTATHAIRTFGYDHVILWDVSETDPDKALKKVRNGSILLYHARERDYNCLVKLIPALLEKGFRPVTVSELLGFGPNEISPELYVYNKEDYRKK